MTTAGSLQASWRKSSYSESGENQSNCIELATAQHIVAVRDSKHPDGPVLCFTPSEFRPFLDRLRDT
ncbi:DUF397 domain-containing protein [Actinocorallia sp. B10E7]|uniref:DUF397 domain-containing protein n=1 Tax=Actinocorallia sp. B10E7 TaxID=3153558 RepID=UPI00325D0328